MVMLTSEDDPEVRAQAADAGVARYMLKSGRADELLRTIRAAATESREQSITVIVGSDHAAEDNLSPPRIA
jgi:DNA-binding NarL/FixJ family response regulator